MAIIYKFRDTTVQPVASPTGMSIQTIFNHTNLDEALTDNNTTFRTLTVEGRSSTVKRLTTLQVTGMDGVHEEQNPTIEPRTPVVKFLLESNTNESFRTSVDTLNHMLSGSKAELRFTDEEYLYYATAIELNIPEEESNSIVGTITFQASNPFKYGPENTFTVQDVAVIENEGTVKADPVVELTATEKATYAMISLGELGIQDNVHYNMIGRPAEVDEQVIDERVLRLTERGETLQNWTTAGTEIDSNRAVAQGQLGTDGTGIVVLTYGSTPPNATWYGPALLQEITPIEDFEIEMRLRAKSSDPSVVYRVEFYLFDENMKSLGKMAIWQNTTRANEYTAEGRVGPFVGTFKNYMISSRNYRFAKGHFHGIIRMRREGQRFEFYVARTMHGEGETGRHYDSLTKAFWDGNNDYQGKLKYVQIHIGTHAKGSKVTLPRINSFKVTELVKGTEDQTPYIVYPGDVVTFDHINDDILINGEANNDLKNFGGSFFKLNPGFNNLVVTPEQTYDGVVRYRDKKL